MEKKHYVCPGIKRVCTEEVMAEPGLHNSVGDGEQLGSDASFEEEETPTEIPYPSIWD